MIEYVIAHDPDDRIIDKAISLIKKGQLICVPSDTNWIALTDPFNKDAVERLHKLKKENLQKHFSLMVNEISKASEVAIIEDYAFKLLKRTTPGHYTFIFEATKKIAKTLKASKMDKEIGLRFVPSKLIDRLLEAFGAPLISTNIPTSILSSFEGSEEIYSYMIEEKLSNVLSLIIDPGEHEFTGQSTIVDFSKGEIEVVREGAGDPSPFL
ncbi:MAG: threonylcarbamoyl-AMP synthase [Bacteriovoracaceae bacterium]|nr:threonylcarbamoyl-AMP synthase [Bacteriovoracaceae bacterium]